MRSMSTWRLGATAWLALTLVVAGSAGQALAQGTVGGQAALDFRVEVDPEPARYGGPAITGYVYNDGPNRLGDVRLHTQIMDGSGRVVAETSGWVYGALPPRGRAFFVLRVPQRGVAYRVTVTSYSLLAIGEPGLQAP
jgi:hypothetical protein